MVTDIIPQLIMSINPEGQMDYCNQQWRKYTGVELKEIMTLGWTSFVHPDEVGKIKHDFRLCLQTQKPLNAECRLRNSVSLYKWFLVTALPLRDDERRVIKWYSSCTDIDDQKRMEEVLEQQVESRTKKLRKSNIALKQINLEMEQFVKVASHDLQEQVRKIQIFSNIIKEDFLQAEENEVLLYVNKIIGSSNKLKKLIVDLLIYSGLSNSNGLISVNLSEVVESVNYTLSELIKESKAIITWQGLPIIDAIEGEMDLVLENLISNSIYFSRKDETPTVHIEAQRIVGLDLEAAVDREGKFVRITVTDNGIGFENQYAELIFQVFEKLANKQKDQSSGIGLAIVKKIIEKYQGIIKASGKPNEGAVFTLVLPQKQ
jgi:PAS domain S-box-containing protein